MRPFSFEQTMKKLFFVLLFIAGFACDASAQLIRKEQIEDYAATHEEVTDHTGATAGAHAASAISVAPFSTIEATDVQSALEEIFNEAAGTGTGTGTDDQTAAEVNVDSTNLPGTATTVQGALEDSCMVTTGAGAPLSSTVVGNCHIYLDTSTTPPTPYYGTGTGNNFTAFSDLGDSFNGLNDGANSAVPSGNATIYFARATGLATEVEIFQGTTSFANQPANDGVEVVSSNVGDTTQTITIYGTTFGGDESSLTIEQIALTGTTVAASVKTDWNNIKAIKLDATTTGTITIREASANLTIATIAPGDTRVANLTTIITASATSTATPTIGATFTASSTGQITGATEAKPFSIYGTGDDGIVLYVDSTGVPHTKCVINGVVNDCDYYRQLAAGKKTGFKDSSGVTQFEYTEGTGLTKEMQGTTKSVQIEVFAPTTAVATGDGKYYFRVPSTLNGYVLTAASANVVTASSSGAIDVDLARCAAAATGNLCSGAVVDMLTTNLTIDANENDSATGTAISINTSNDDVATGQIIRIDVDGQGTGAQGLIVNMDFRLP